jgi:aryl-alcohol dehydrogenase-like predicted oxidoreductase
MDLNPQGLSWNELALRFCAGLPGVASCIVGTSNIEHFRHNLEMLAQGPLNAGLQQHIRKAFARHGDAWPGII